MQYELLQVSPDKLETAVRQFQRTGGKGLNITVPHKQEVAKLADLLEASDQTEKALSVLTALRELAPHLRPRPRLLRIDVIAVRFLRAERPEIRHFPGRVLDP